MKFKCFVCEYESNDESEFVTDEDFTEVPICRDCWENQEDKGDEK